MTHSRTLISVALFTAIYLPVFPPLVREWIANPDYSHAFLIPFISAYFLWTKREELKKTPVSPSWAGCAIIIAGIALNLLGRAIANQVFLSRFSMIIVIFGMVYAQAGRQMAKKTAFAVGYLIFMIPPPLMLYTPFTFNLRLFSTRLAFGLLGLIGMNVTMSGNIIDLPTCSLVVENPCSGLRGLIVYMAASLALGYLYQPTVRNRAILFVSAIGLAIAMNMVRLAATAVYSDLMALDRISISAHDAAGLASLAAGLFILFWFNDVLKKWRQHP